MDSQTHKLMDAKQKLLETIDRLSEAQISRLLEVALHLQARGENATLFTSSAYQEWLSPENDVYDELLA